MLLVRTGGIFGVIISLVVAGIFLFVVRPAINDTTDRAFDTANRAIDTATQQTADIQNAVDKATSDLDANGDFMSAASFSAVVGDLKSEIGADGELLDLTVNPMGGTVKYRTGDKASGFQWGTGLEGLQPVDVTLVGSGKVEDNVFPIAKLQADATEKLAAAVKAEKGAAFEITSMTLGLNPVSGAVKWTVSGEGDGRSLVFQADADASGLKQLN